MMPGEKVNLLIADDEPSIRRAFSEIFTEFGYNVRSAEDGFTALVAIRREIPDILLSDLNMPGVSGFELLTVVRDEFPAIQAIAMSGDYSGVGIPPGVCAAAFYEKGSRLDYLLQIVEGMAHPKRLSPLQLPSPNNGHGSSGYAHIRLTCPECLKIVFKRSRQNHLSCSRSWLRLLLQLRFVTQPPSRNTWHLRRLFGGSQTCGSSRLRERPIATRERNKKELPRCGR